MSSKLKQGHPEYLWVQFQQDITKVPIEQCSDVFDLRKAIQKAFVALRSYGHEQLSLFFETKGGDHPIDLELSLDEMMTIAATQKSQDGVRGKSSKHPIYVRLNESAGKYFGSN